MSRRFFVKFLLAMGLGAYFPKLTEAARLDELHTPQDDYNTLTSIKFLRQIVTSDSRTSRMIMWQADSEENFLLEWQRLGEESAHFAEVNQRNLFYSCMLENLEPESLYRFRIVNGNRASSWQNLFTAGNGNFQMLIFADSQCEHYNIWERTADIAAEKFPDAQLVTVIGDLVDNGQADYQWNAWHSAAVNLLRGKIFAPVMGNHECYGVDWFNSLPIGYVNQFNLPNNGTTKFENYFYSFDYGAAHFVVLNTQFVELDALNAGMQDAQNYFLRRDIANANRPWKIVLMHKDIYDYAQDKFNDIADKFLDVFDELEIDFVFTGHLHTYRNRGRIFARKKSDRGTIYILCGRAGDQKYVEPNSDIDDVTAPNLRQEPETFIELNISADEINLICHSVDGNIFDNFTVRKDLTNGF
ncbi:MAG: metallophosphoesterase [Selenomonadaceae bacterium]|nr:metallophosphoesterase [Selenomonadaceae bacterium]